MRGRGEQKKVTKKPADRDQRAWRNGAEGQNRTADTGIFSPLLYRLSYLGTHRKTVSRVHFLKEGSCFVKRFFPRAEVAEEVLKDRRGRDVGRFGLDDPRPQPDEVEAGRRSRLRLGC